MEKLNNSLEKVGWKKNFWRKNMSTIAKLLGDYYTNYTMLLVVGSGLIIYFSDYKKMVKQKAQKEAKISRFMGLTYIWGGILLYLFVMFFG